MLIGNAGQATSEGKRGLVETELTGPAATALYILVLMSLSVVFSR